MNYGSMDYDIQIVDAADLGHETIGAEFFIHGQCIARRVNGQWTSVDPEWVVETEFFAEGGEILSICQVDAVRQ